MSVHVLSWVLRHSEERLGNRLVLLVLADKANEDGTDAWPAVATIAREARMSERSVQYALRALEQSGAITNTGLTAHGTHRYTVVMGGAESAPLGATGVQSSTRIVSDSAPEPSLEPSYGETTPNGVASPARASTAIIDPRTPIDDHIFAGAPEGVWKVDRKPVKWEHARLAMDVLAIWNELTGQDLRRRDWLAKIVMRIREYPEATTQDHRFLIAQNLAVPWWKGAATPSVIYGNGAQFERAIQTARSTGGSDRLEAIVAAVQARQAS